MNPKVDAYIARTKEWQEEIRALRAIVLSCHLTEELKWGVPCYTFQEKNIVLLHAFKEYCAALFVKGSLLKDPEGILIQQTENVQAGRQIRFANTEEISELESAIHSYILEAIEIEKAGLKVPLKKTTEFTMPDEFRNVLEDNPALQSAFTALTPGRQRGYLLYFSSAKQSKTRISRIEKYIPHIQAGKGLDDE